MTEKNVTVYTLEGCGKCEIIKKKMASMGIKFKIVDCSANPGIARIKGYKFFPVVELGSGEDVDRAMPYAQAAEWLREQDL